MDIKTHWNEWVQPTAVTQNTTISAEVKIYLCIKNDAKHKDEKTVTI